VNRGGNHERGKKKNVPPFCRPSFVGGNRIEKKRVTVQGGKKRDIKINAIGKGEKKEGQTLPWRVQQTKKIGQFFAQKQGRKSCREKGKVGRESPNMAGR